MTNPIPEPSDELVLLPCPFCGAELSKFPTVNGKAFWMRHPENGCEATRLWIAPEAIAAWNTRSPELSALQEKVEEIWREGWTAGYRAGVIDGGSDSCWSDENGDWEKFKARTALTDTVGGV